MGGDKVRLEERKERRVGKERSDGGEVGEIELSKKRCEERRGDRRCNEESCLSVLHQVGVPVFLSDVIRGGSSPAPAAPPVSRLQHINIHSLHPAWPRSRPS